MSVAEKEIRNKICILVGEENVQKSWDIQNVSLTFRNGEIFSYNFNLSISTIMDLIDMKVLQYLPDIQRGKKISKSGIESPIVNVALQSAMKSRITRTAKTTPSMPDCTTVFNEARTCLESSETMWKVTAPSVSSVVFERTFFTLSIIFIVSPSLRFVMLTKSNGVFPFVTSYSSFG